MKSHSLFSVRMLVTTLCGIGLAAGIVVHRAQADQWDKRTVLTVDQPIQIRDTYLPAGSYVLKLLNSPSDRHIVQIFNGDQTHLIGTVLAIPNYQLEPSGHSEFRFWETPAGYAKAMRAWFYPGDNYGQEFAYPKHLRQLETASAAVTAPVSPSVTTEENTSANREETETTPMTQPAQPTVQEPIQEEQKPTEVAQAAPPPAPQTTAPAPAEPAPKTLPKTGSPYPTIGLVGLISFALYGLLRLKRIA